jgi:hypothetical protein
MITIKELLVAIGSFDNLDQPVTIRMRDNSRIMTRIEEAKAEIVVGDCGLEGRGLTIYVDKDKFKECN